MSRIYTPELILKSNLGQGGDPTSMKMQYVCERERKRERRKEPSHWLWLNIIYMQIGCLTTKHCQICGFIDAPVACHSQVQMIPTTQYRFCLYRFTHLLWTVCSTANSRQLTFYSSSAGCTTILVLNRICTIARSWSY